MLTQPITSFSLPHCRFALPLSLPCDSESNSRKLHFRQPWNGTYTHKCTSCSSSYTFVSIHFHGHRATCDCIVIADQTAPESWFWISHCETVMRGFNSRRRILTHLPSRTYTCTPTRTKTNKQQVQMRKRALGANLRLERVMVLKLIPWFSKDFSSSYVPESPESPKQPLLYSQTNITSTWHHHRHPVCSKIKPENTSNSNIPYFTPLHLAFTYVTQGFLHQNFQNKPVVSHYS